MNLDPTVLETIKTLDEQTIKTCYVVIKDRYDHNVDAKEDFKLGLTTAMMVLSELRMEYQRATYEGLKESKE